jgi:hypothetical protein
MLMAYPIEAALDHPGQNPRQLDFNFSGKCSSRSAGGIVTVNGIRWKRRRMASSTDLSPGLWLPAMMSLNMG